MQGSWFAHRMFAACASETVPSPESIIIIIQNMTTMLGVIGVRTDTIRLQFDNR